MQHNIWALCSVQRAYAVCISGRQQPRQFTWQRWGFRRHIDHSAFFYCAPNAGHDVQQSWLAGCVNQLTPDSSSHSLTHSQLRSLDTLPPTEGCVINSQYIAADWLRSNIRGIVPVGRHLAGLVCAAPALVFKRLLTLEESADT
jgi:hypothetical protein